MARLIPARHSGIKQLFGPYPGFGASFMSVASAEQYPLGYGQIALGNTHLRTTHQLENELGSTQPPFPYSHSGSQQSFAVGLLHSMHGQLMNLQLQTLYYQQLQVANQLQHAYQQPQQQWQVQYQHQQLVQHAAQHTGFSQAPPQSQQWAPHGTQQTGLSHAPLQSQWQDLSQQFRPMSYDFQHSTQPKAAELTPWKLEWRRNLIVKLPMSCANAAEGGFEAVPDYGKDEIAVRTRLFRFGQVPSTLIEFSSGTYLPWLWCGLRQGPLYGVFRELAHPDQARYLNEMKLLRIRC
ncbi:MAG: hypothetical protein J3Q66DRAFT_391609 [Benniella sp.]|nr:MAG: hypothetical protein J3Q66DRAFT_391609 [Benniella sp.]